MAELWRPTVAVRVPLVLGTRGLASWREPPLALALGGLGQPTPPLRACSSLLCRGVMSLLAQGCGLEQ